MAGIKVFSSLAGTVASGMKAVGSTILEYGASAEEMENLNGQFSTLKENFQGLSEEIVGGMAEGVGSQFFPIALDWVNQLSVGFSENGTQGLMDALGTVLADLTVRVSEYTPQILELAVSILQQFFAALNSNSAIILESGGELLMQLLNGIIAAIPILLQTSTDLVYGMMGTIDNEGESIIQQGIEIIKNLALGLVGNLPTLIAAVLNLIMEMLAAIIGELPSIISAGVEIVMALISGLASALPDLLLGVASLCLGILEFFMNLDFGEVGLHIINGIISGLWGAFNSLIETVKTIFNNVLDAAKNLLGIHSPSRKFKYIGEMCVAGWEEGSEDLFDAGTMAKDINATLSVARANISGAQGAAGRGGYTQNVYVNKAVSTPDEVARAIRVESRYGLIGGVAFA